MEPEDISADEFKATCWKSGLTVSVGAIGNTNAGKVYITGNVSSPVLRDGKASFCDWNNFLFSDQIAHVDFYEALWLEHSTLKYTINDNELGDSPTTVYTRKELEEACLNLIDALDRLESDPGYRPDHIDLTPGKYVRKGMQHADT